MYEHYRPGSSFTGGRLADRVEARLDELKAENARLRAFVAYVADRPIPDGQYPAVVSIRARELLNELEVTA